MLYASSPSIRLLLSCGIQLKVERFFKCDTLQFVQRLGPKNELERSANLATKTRFNIKFFGHIDKISTLHLGIRWHICQAYICIYTVYRIIENRCTRKWRNTHLTRRLKKTHLISGNVVQIGEFWPSLGHTCIESMYCYKNVISS